MLSFASALENVRRTSPLVHCISNQVAANDCANAVLACGASPIMADDPAEAAEVTALCRGLSLSLGTISPRKAQALLLAGKKANELNLPVLFDPVGVGVSQLRRDTAEKLLAQVQLTALRCNVSEMQALLDTGKTTRGVDADTALNTAASVELLARTAAEKLHCVVTVTGATDVVTDGTKTYFIHGGHRLMRSVTGTGCMLSVITAAFLAANPDTPLEAAATAAAAMGLCGRQAAQRMQPQDGTGSYRVYLMDALLRLEPSMLAEFENEVKQ